MGLGPGPGALGPELKLVDQVQTKARLSETSREGELVGKSTFWEGCLDFGMWHRRIVLMLRQADIGMLTPKRRGQGGGGGATNPLRVCSQTSPTFWQWIACVFVVS